MARESVVVQVIKVTCDSCGEAIEQSSHYVHGWVEHRLYDPESELARKLRRAEDGCVDLCLECLLELLKVDVPL